MGSVVESTGRREVVATEYWVVVVTGHWVVVVTGHWVVVVTEYCLLVASPKRLPVWLRWLLRGLRSRRMMG